MSAHTVGDIESPHDGRDRAATSERSPFHFRRFLYFHSPYKDFIFYTSGRRREVMTSKELVRIENERDRWRYVCPLGHRTWEPTNHHFWCQQCARRDDVDGAFYKLRDRKTDALLVRHQVQLVTPTGPYDDDLDGGAQ